GECCRSGVDSAHLLSSRTKTAGTFQSCAMFNASWNVPMFVAPSPKNATATRGSPRSWNASAMPVICGRPPPTTAFAPMFPRSTSYRCIEPPYPCEQPSSFPYSSAISSFGAVPFASVCPCARCVDAITSPSSSARQTPTLHASCPIATCRKPGSSPARKRSSTFSSKRRISSISRRTSRRSLSVNDFLLSTFATRRECTVRRMRLAERWNELQRGLDPRWTDARLLLRVDDEARVQRALALLGPATPGRSGREIRFFVTRGGSGVAPDAVRRMLQRIDGGGIGAALDLVSSDAAPPAPEIAGRTLAGDWDAALATLPSDWSDVLAELELTSSDHVERAALL